MVEFPTKDELELLDSPLKEKWKEAINRYWSEQYQEYKKEQERESSLYNVRSAEVRYNTVDY